MVLCARGAVSKGKRIKGIMFKRYAIFQNGGKQYQAIEGKTIALEKMNGNIGDVVTLDDVLLRKLDDASIEIGQPKLQGSIKATIVRQTRGPKLIVFKFKRRKKSRVKRGHRQHITVVRVTSIA